MPQQQLQTLNSKWTFWLSFACEYQKDINYSNNITKLITLQTWQDFMFFWKHSSFTNPSNYFINPITGKFNKYQIGQQIRKIDSINIFKDECQPKWQYGDNSKGGYFNFSIMKDEMQETIQNIYRATVFLAVGNIQQVCSKLVGVRIVDTLIKQNKKNQCRIQLWVNFRHDNSEQSLKMLQEQKQIIMKYYQSSMNYSITQMKFFNISK